MRALAQARRWAASFGTASPLGGVRTEPGAGYRPGRMRRRRPSQTASFVALARALANDGFTTIPGFADPIARVLLSPPWKALHRLMSRSLRRASRARRERVIAVLDAIPLRVKAIDAELEAAANAGVKQVVILGAGLDTRALRMPSLASMDVFEVDHPATQAYKRRKTSGMRPLAASLRFVPVDFERSSLIGSLRQSGFDPGQATVWIWEGVVMYLTDQAVRRTLVDVAWGSAQGSLLLLTYHVPAADGLGAEARVRSLFLSLWREPQIGLRTTDSMHEAVRGAGFAVLSDTRPAQWAQALGAGAPSGHTAEVSRLLVAGRETALRPPPPGRLQAEPGSTDRSGGVTLWAWRTQVGAARRWTFAARRFRSSSIARTTKRSSRRSAVPERRCGSLRRTSNS